MQYLSEFCDVRYEEKFNVVFVAWKKYCCLKDYRKPLKFALTLMKNNKGCNYVADTRTGFENHPDDTKWVADVFIPTAVECGCKYVFFIIDKNNTLKEELEGQETDSKDKLQFRYFYSLNEIGAFLQSNN